MFFILSMEYMSGESIAGIAMKFCGLLYHCILEARLEDYIVMYAW
jgi:hypothetical protein